MERASPKNNYHYNPKLRSRANQLRKTMTKSEACLWKYVLRARKMKGYQFRRQRPVLNYIADFLCKELLLIVEVDGITHDDPDADIRDRRRDKQLKAVGFTTLRFSSWEVLNRIGEVGGMISVWIEEYEKVHPLDPPPAGDKTPST